MMLSLLEAPGRSRRATATQLLNYSWPVLNIWEKLLCSFALILKEVSVTCAQSSKLLQDTTAALQCLIHMQQSIRGSDRFPVCLCVPVSHHRTNIQNYIFMCHMTFVNSDSHVSREWNGVNASPVYPGQWRIFCRPNSA